MMRRTTIALLWLLCSLTALAQVKYTGGRVWVETYRDSSHATTTTANLKAAIAFAKEKGYELFIPEGDYLVNTGVLTIDDQLTISGAGYKRTRFYAAGAGAVFTVDAALSQSTGRGPRIHDLGIYSNRATSAAGDIGIKVTNTGSANSAFVWISDVIIEGAFDVALDMTNVYFSSVRNSYLGQYRRHGIRISSTYTVDAGDHVIDGNWIHPATSAAGGWVTGGSNIALHQAPGTRITNNKLFPGHAIGVHIHPNATFSTEAFPTGMYVIGPANQFDSYGANTFAVVVEGTWGTGVTGEAEHGNKVANVQVVGNNLSNVGGLLDIRSEAAYVISAIANHAIGGGGIKISTNAVVDHLTLVGNTFDNRLISTGAGASGSGYGPTKPVERLGTVSNYKGSGNHYIGFSGAPDMADSGGSGGSVDLTEESTQLAYSSSKLRIPGNVGAFANTWAVSTGSDTLTWAVAGDTSISDGAQGRHHIHYSGASVAPKFAAPTGYTLVREKGDTLPTAVDNLLVGIPWYVQGARIFYSIVNYDTIAGLTSEGGGGGAIMEDGFGGSGALHGWTPDVTAGPTTWVSTGTWVFTRTSGWAQAQTEINANATYDVGTANVQIVCSLKVESADVFPSIRFNQSAGGTFWYFAWRASDGYVRIIDPSGAEVASASIGALSGDYVFTVIAKDDDITIKNGATTILNYNASGRTGQDEDIIGLANGGSGVAEFYHITVSAAP